MAFLKIPEIKGEGWAKKHEGEIALMSWDWGEEQEASAASASARPKVVMKDLSFTAVTSSASPQLMLSGASGRILKKVTLTCSQTQGTEIWDYCTLTLCDVQVSSYHVGMAPGTSEPVDLVTLSFRKIEFEYVSGTKDHKEGSSFHSSWDLGQNK